MINIGLGLSTEKNPTLAIKEALRKAIISLPNKKANLAIVFSSPGNAHPNVLKTISYSMPGISIIGASGSAVFSSQGVFKNALALMLLELPAGFYFNTSSIKGTSSNPTISLGAELGNKLLYRFHNLPRSLGIIISDGLIEEDSNIIYGLQERLGKSFPLIGASTSYNHKTLEMPLYSEEEILNDATTAMIFGGNLNFGLGIKHGWKPLGKPHTITSAYANAIREIDNVPAARFYESYLLCDINTLKRELKHVSMLYPIGIRIPGEKEYLLRNITAIEDDGAIYLRGKIAEGSIIRLMIGTKTTCLEAAKEAAQEAQQSLAGPIMGVKKNDSRKFAIVFNSFSRYSLLQRETNNEIKVIKDILGDDIPLIGICTYGELAPLRTIAYRGEIYFHNQTISVLLIEG